MSRTFLSPSTKFPQNKNCNIVGIILFIPLVRQHFAYNLRIRVEEKKKNQKQLSCPSTTLRRWPRCHRRRTSWTLSSLELSVRRQQWFTLGTRLQGFVVSSELTVLKVLFHVLWYLLSYCSHTTCVFVYTSSLLL